MKTFLRDLRWILPSSLLVGLALGLFSPGAWWVGWLAYSFLLLVGLSIVAALWRSAGSVKALLVFSLAALLLRLCLGIAYDLILPVYGNDSFIQKAGFIVRDAYSYDNESWKLATSGESLLKAFDRPYKLANQYDDQYGGLLFFHSLAYRYLSPDAQRSWLLVLLSALVGALGVVFAWKGTQKAWGGGAAVGVACIMAFFPDSILEGSSAVREPFLILFVAMAFWGAVSWMVEHHRRAWVWLAVSVVGLLLYSPGVAAVELVVLGVWMWLSGRERRIRWWWYAALAAVAVLAALLLSVAAAGTLQARGGPLANLFNWLMLAANYGAQELEQNSGWVQAILAKLPAPLHLPFIVSYGILQPVLPAAVMDPAVVPMRVLGILRGLGWYALLPLLVYSLRPIYKIPEKRERLSWLWLWVVSWLWIIVSSLRGGGDQWNNPRYRVILLLFQAAVVVKAVVWQRLTHDRWLWRILAVEGVFLLLFGYWYLARYAHWQAGQVHIFVIMGLIVLISGLILVAGWVTDRRNANRA